MKANTKLQTPNSNRADEVLRAQVGRLKGPVLARLSEQAWRLYDTALEGMTTAERQELGPLLDLLLKPSALFSNEQGRRRLAEAERKDRGRVCWEIFSPRNSTPLQLSCFDQQRHVVRTPHRKIIYGEYFSIEPAWRVEESDPWEDFARAQKPVDLVAFARYARDVDECIRRKLARDGSLDMKEAA